MKTLPPLQLASSVRETAEASKGPINANHLAPTDAAAYLGVCEQTLAIWRCTKRYPLPYIKVGRLVRYRVSDLEAFLVLRTIEATSGN